MTIRKFNDELVAILDDREFIYNLTHDTIMIKNYTTGEPARFTTDHLTLFLEQVKLFLLKGE